VGIIFYETNIYSERREIMSDNRDFNSESIEHRSVLSFGDQVIEKIVAVALEGVDGVTVVKSGGGAFGGRLGKSTDGINVEVGEKEVAVDLRLVLEFGKNAKEIYDSLKATIEDQVMSMTGLKVVEVNAKVEDVLSSEEFRARIEG